MSFIVFSPANKYIMKLSSLELNYPKKTIEFCSFWLDWNGLKTPYLEYGRVISIKHSGVKTKMQSTSFDL